MIPLAVFCAATFAVNAPAAPASGASSGPSSGPSSGASSGPSTTADGARTIRLDADFSWNGVRDCGTQRPGSVICISGQATIPGVGLVEYARDAVPNGETTPDGCPEFSTHGTLWVPGGTAQFEGTPVPTCGATDSPDAHYAYTIHDGAGVLAGAGGTGDVVADNGVDRWHGTLTFAAQVKAPASTPVARLAAAKDSTAVTSSKKPSTFPVVTLVAVLGGVAALLGGAALVLCRRKNSGLRDT